MNTPFLGKRITLDKNHILSKVILFLSKNLFITYKS